MEYKSYFPHSNLKQTKSIQIKKKKKKQKKTVISENNPK